MIRVGDIYSDNTKMTHNCLVTFVSRNTVNILAANGGMFTFENSPKQEADFLRNRKLIAEYPTWREAVNSKEFKND